MRTTTKNRAACACPAMLFSGVCASSSGVIVALLQEHYALDYQWSGLLLAMLSVGNLAAGFAAGVLPAHWGMRRTALTLACGAAVGYAVMALTGRPWALLAAFALIGVGKGTTLNTSSTLVAAYVPNRTRGMNLMHACFAAGSMLSPLVIAALGRTALPWQAPMVWLAGCGAVLWLIFALAGLPGPAGGGPAGRNDWSFLRSRRFWVLTGLIFFQNCAETSVTGWVVTYFKDAGILSGAAGQMTVVVVWGAMLGARLCIAFLMHIQNSFRALTLMSVCSAGAYLLLLRAQTPAAALVCLFLFGVAIAGVNPTAVAAGNALSGAGLGVMLPAAGVGAVLMPYLTGAVAQRLGIWAGMMSTVFALAGMAVCAAALMLRRPGRGAGDAAQPASPGGSGSVPK